MAFDLSSITRGKRLRAPKIVVYGPPKIGKSTFAASAPSAVGILTEEGLDNIDVAAFPVAKTYEDVLAAITTLANDAHEFNSVFVDSLDWLEPLILGKICRENGVDNIEKIGYGKGYGTAGRRDSNCGRRDRVGFRIRRPWRSGSAATDRRQPGRRRGHGHQPAGERHPRDGRHPDGSRAHQPACGTS